MTGFTNRLVVQVILVMILFLAGLHGVTFAQTQARTGEGSATADNSTVIVSAGTTELRFSEVSFFGPNTHWEINGTLEIFSKQIWIAPTARFTGTGKIIIHNPGDNPYYDQMAAGPTHIDGNNGEFIGVTIELRNPHNLVLANLTDPGYGTADPTAASKKAALNIGSNFIFAVDEGDVILNGHDFGLSQTAVLQAASGGSLGAKRMIVTGNSITGHVIKHFANSQPVLFPVGVSEGDYTPATIAPRSPAAIYVSVQDYSAASPAISAAERGMDRIWHIYADQGVQATYTLQHNRITNGVAYVDNRANIVQYAGSGNWVGDVTTLQGEGIHTRADILTATGVSLDQSWFTKLTDSQAPPQAIDDEMVGNSCDPIQINVLQNDKPGGSAILVNSVRIIEQPRFGMVVVNIDGSITYTANNGYTGDDYFIYGITDENGLTAEARVNMTITECNFKIPNVFTPDGDGINDFFEIVGIDLFDRVEILITNRWGNEVYRNDNYRNQWAGHNLNEGVYYYQITTHKGSQRNQYVSWVLLKRNL